MGNIDLGHLLFGFSGRINRGKYWLAVLIFIIVSVVASIIGLVIGSATVLMILNLVVGIGTLISAIAVGIKRLHDRDRSGWWLLIFYLLPGVLSAVSIGFAFMGILGGATGDVTTAMATGGMGSMLLSLASFAIAIWGFVELGCLRGTVGPNQYGPDPLEARY